MKITTNKLYDNKTKKYLLPIIKDYGNDVLSRINRLFKLAIGIDDAAISRSLNLNYHLFFLLDANIKKASFISDLEWLRQQYCYATDYPYGDIKTSNLHMLVIKIPENHKITYDHFVNNAFSKMYSEENIKKYFKPGDERIKILTKDRVATESFVNDINTHFDTDYVYEEWVGEVEYPVKNSEEIFNFGIQEKVITKD